MAMDLKKATHRLGQAGTLDLQELLRTASGKQDMTSTFE